MKFLWLTNTDPNISEDMILLGLATLGHVVEVRPWKTSFSWVADPSIHGGNYLSCALSTFPRCTIKSPDVIVVTRAGASALPAFDEFKSTPVVYYDTEDKFTDALDVLKERIVLYFAAQTPVDRTDIISLPYAYRADLITARSGGKRPIGVSWGGTMQIGHGGRWELLVKALSQGSIDVTITRCPAVAWYLVAQNSCASISIGGAQNFVAGVNARHFEIAALGASVLSYRHRTRIETEIPEGIRFFSNADELADLCKEKHPPLSKEMVDWNERYNSHIARADQFVRHLNDRGIR